MRPPATKGNKKKDKLGDKLGDKGGNSGRRAHHPMQANNRRHGGDKTWKADGIVGGKHYPPQAHMWEDHERQENTRPREVGHTFQHRGDKTLGKADTASTKETQEGLQWEKEGDKTLGKADTPPTTGT